MTTVAIDPGISTGVAIHRTDVKCPNCHGMLGEHVFALRDQCRLDPHRRCNDDGFLPDEYLMLVITEPLKVWEVLQHHRPDTVVIENFASGGLISKDGQATIRLVGAVELAAYILHSRLVLQFPQERTPFIQPARDMIKQRGATPISHEVDALAHLLLYEHRLQNGTLDKLTSNRRKSFVD